MVRPAKQSDIKQNVTHRLSPKPKLKSIDRFKTNSDDRYPAEASIRMKRPQGLELGQRTPLTKKSSQEKIQSSSVTKAMKTSSPKTSKISKTQSYPTALPQNKTKSGSKSKNRRSTGEKKKAELSKMDPINRLLQIPEVELDPDRTSLPLRDKFTGANAKMQKTVSKIPKRKGLQKNLLPTPELDEITERALLTHFRRLDIRSNELLSKKPVEILERRVKKSSKLKASDGNAPSATKSKQVKPKKKSKLNRSKPVDSEMSSDSVPVSPIKEIKHNDSFVISARKLQNAAGGGRNAQQPEYIKLCKRTTSINFKTDSYGLKPCLKKGAAIKTFT